MLYYDHKLTVDHIKSKRSLELVTNCRTGRSSTRRIWNSNRSVFQTSRGVHGPDWTVGNALSQLPTDRRRVDQKPPGEHPRGAQVHSGSPHDRTQQRHAAAGRSAGLADPRDTRLEAGTQSKFYFTR